MGIVARLAMLTLTPLVTRPLTNLLDVWTAAGACIIQHHMGCCCLMLPSALAVASHQLQAAVALTCPPEQHAVCCSCHMAIEIAQIRPSLVRLTICWGSCWAIALT